MDRERHLREPILEPEIRGRREERVPADDDEHLDLPGVHRLHEIAQRRHLIGRVHFDRRRVRDRRPDVAERLVHRVRERMHRRRLIVAGDDEALAAARLQLLRDRGRPLRGLCGRGRRRRAPARA